MYDRIRVSHSNIGSLPEPEARLAGCQRPDLRPTMIEDGHRGLNEFYICCNERDGKLDCRRIDVHWDFRSSRSCITYSAGLRPHYKCRWRRE